MASDKLTARLSDGRELEVCSEWHAKEDDYTMIVAKPASKKPSPPKEVFLRMYSDESVSATYRTAQEAVEYTRGFSGPSNIHRYILAPEPEEKKSAIVEEIEKLGARRTELYSKMNAINAETKRCKQCRQCGLRFESESITAELCKTCWKSYKKPAREWWGVKHKACNEAFAIVPTKEQAQATMRRMEGLADFEIVHVREVVSE